MKIIAFTGAGISKQSNIPTFMERPDIREKLFRSYARKYPKDYNQVIKEMKMLMKDALPHDGHYALAQYHIPVITMNIDGLHTLAGSHPIELHGCLPDDDELDYAHTLYNKPVLYGDVAPMYEEAYKLVGTLKKGDVLLVIGCSYHTEIAVSLREVARYLGADVIEIQHDAASEVRKVIEKLLNKKEVMKD